MITRENLTDVISMIKNKDKKRILKSNKEFCVLELLTFNVGSYVTIKLTDDFNRYKNVSDHGNCILNIEEVKELVKEIK